MRFVLLFAILFLCSAESCDISASKAVPLQDVPAESVEGARFVVERCGRFSERSSLTGHEIFLVTDSETKRQYLGITGLTVVEIPAVKPE